MSDLSLTVILRNAEQAAMARHVPSSVWQLGSRAMGA